MQALRRWAPWAIVAGMFAVVVFGIVSTNVSRAQQQVQLECHTALVIDRSASVGTNNLIVIRDQIRRLFEPGGLYDDLIRLAFWSFSSTTNRTSNYDAPFHGFVSSRGVHPGFMTQLNAIVSKGGTNYEQGFAFDRGIPNTYDNIDSIVDQADIIVFMTDGEPNTPGVGDNNSRARQAARDAVLIHKANGKSIVGGIIGDANPASLNFVINGSNGNSTNTFKVNNFDELYEILDTIIQQKCSELIPPDGREYALTPRVETDDRISSGTGSVSFRYSVNNSSDTSSSFDTDWSIKRVMVPRGQSVEPLIFSSPPYRDGYSCAQLEALVNNNGTCTDVTSGSRVFGPGANDMTLDVGNAANVVMNDSWPVGTKLCFVLTVDRPTHQSNPVDRYSSAACTTVGKRPLVQIWGGDLKVGRYFLDNPVDDSLRFDVVGNTIAKSDGNTYGSWAEYAVFTPGVVSGFATMAGLNGGYSSTQPTAQELWSSLTFANTEGEYGLFTEEAGTLGSVPDVVDAILAGAPDAANIGEGDPPLDLNGNVANGVYRKTDGDLTIRGNGTPQNRITIAQNKSLVVYVEEGTVTIAGNIEYNDGPYTDIRDIPQLVIIAQNIEIEEDVTRVDAWLIAYDESGSEDTGNINTCNIGGPLTSEVCNSLLRINGPVMARTLDLLRTGGAGAGGAAGDPAEIINLPANTYLWSHTEGRSDLRIQTTYTTELPPYF